MADGPQEITIRGAARSTTSRTSTSSCPATSLIVFTGISGSGKSSLAFDTIYAEGQRRYVESLSAYARQFLGQMDKPDVDFIEGLSPAISIDQKSASRNPRSTVGTITEIYDYLRLLYARIGVPHCPNCGRVITRQTPQQIVDRVLQLPDGTRFQVLAPVVRGRKGEYEGLLEELAGQGYTRARIDGDVVELSEFLHADQERQAAGPLRAAHHRGRRRPARAPRRHRASPHRLARDGAAAGRGRGRGRDRAPRRARTRARRSCSPSTSPARTAGSRSRSSRPGTSRSTRRTARASAATGSGTRFEVDPELIVPDDDLSIADGAIAPWSGFRSQYFDRLLGAIADEYGFSVDTPWRKLRQEGQAGRPVRHRRQRRSHVRYKNRYGRQRSYTTSFEGVMPWLERRHVDSESDRVREQIEGYMREVPCPACERRAPAAGVARGHRSAALNIYELGELSIAKAAEFLGELELSERDRMIAERVLKEVNERLRFLLDVGLDYLSLNRSSATLAGGEAQRIRLASQIGSGLVGVLYVLDEPSIGLHQRDNRRLIDTMVRLRDLGNTVIVVEHDEETIRIADLVVDIGPGAGEHGGEVIAAGSLDDVLTAPRSITGKYLSGERSIAIPEMRRQPGEAWLTVRGARRSTTSRTSTSSSRSGASSRSRA